MGLVASYRKTARDVARLQKLLKMGSRAQPYAPTRKHARQLRPAEIDVLVTRFRAGRRTPELGREFGIHRTLVAQHLRSRGIVVEQKAMTVSDINAAVRLYESGMSLARIGGRLGFSSNSVRTHLVRRGVVMRPRRGGYRSKSS